MKKKEIHLFIIVFIVCTVSILFSIILEKLFAFSPQEILGIFTGSFNSSSSLAILIENEWKPVLITTYGIVYPVGLILPILFINFVPKLLRIDVKKEISRLKKEEKSLGDALIVRKFSIENPNSIGKKLSELNIREETGATISRIRRKGAIIIPTGETVLKLADVVAAVGTNESLEKLHKMLGNETFDDLEIDPQVESRHILITNPSVHDTSLETLGINHNYHAVVTRIWRGGIELAPSSDFIIHLGDTILAVGGRKNLERLCNFLGKREKILGEVDLFSMAFGVFFGILIGRVPIPFPGLGKPIVLGISGGVLIVGMILGYFRRLGFLTGQMSQSAKLVLKEVGLSLFLAGIGTKAGSMLGNIEMADALRMILSSFLLVSVILVVAFITIYRFLKKNFLSSIALLCGSLMSSTAIGTIAEAIGIEELYIIFATTYPISLFGIIISSQILSLIVGN
jgi:putative transport protein